MHTLPGDTLRRALPLSPGAVDDRRRVKALGAVASGYRPLLSSLPTRRSPDRCLTPLARWLFLSCESGDSCTTSAQKYTCCLVLVTPTPTWNLSTKLPAAARPRYKISLTKRPGRAS